MINFLNQLYQHANNGWLTIWTKPDKQTRWFPVNNLPIAVQTATKLSVNHDVYFGVGLAANQKFAGRLTANDVTQLPGLWFDFDIADQTHKKATLPKNQQEVVEFLRADPMLPTIIVDSGHGFHVYWLFREMWDISDPEEHRRAQQLLVRFQYAIHQRAAARGWKFDSTHDLSRILRLPGTINYKSDPCPVRVIHQSADRYNPDDFDGLLPDIPQTNTVARKEQFKRHKNDGSVSAVIDNCAFIQQVVTATHMRPEPEWMAAVTNLARCKDGPEFIHEAIQRILPSYDHVKTNDKINHALQDMHPQTCQYIRESLGFAGCPDPVCDVKAPCGWALLKKKRKKPEPADRPGFENRPGFEKLTDLGNAERFARMFAGQVRYCRDIGGWLIWDGMRWKIDTTSKIMGFAKKTIRQFYVEAAKIDSADIRDAVVKHARRSESLPRMSAMITLAQHMLSIEPEQLDNDYWLLNCKNGIIDLKTGKLLPHDPQRNITKLAPVEFNSKSQCPVFEKFISQIFDGNENIIRFMQRFLGYCLTGDTREQVFAIAYGARGQNGKGTLLNLVHDIMGDYSKQTQTETFMSKKNDSISNDIAALRGSRYVLASETQAGRRFNESLIKQLTGQDIISARFLHKEFFEFLPQFKIVIIANDKPVARGDDAALWRRVILVPFTQRFDGDKKDDMLRYKLREPNEMQGVLKWLVDGCLEWQKKGLKPPDEVKQATCEYHAEMDIVANWIEDNCILGQFFTEKTSILYQNFMNYASETGEKVFFSQKKFTQNLIQKGYETFKGGAGVRKMRGLALVDKTHETQEFNDYSANKKTDPY